MASVKLSTTRIVYLTTALFLFLTTMSPTIPSSEAGCRFPRPICKPKPKSPPPPPPSAMWSSHIAHAAYLSCAPNILGCGATSL
ncbi:hypothetical protein GQ55_8G192800 [Panicum hallii var. hallii]|uniref:Uncharacterized protein n=1 Tax=Panicum hallii var. hallii TaxID=1504633 RepID=A0A2T7CP23_9POAL|nr:hypothetical protein GQ55_8G192800 [Panicum hallii var. hallii]